MKIFLSFRDISNCLKVSYKSGLTANIHFFGTFIGNGNRDGNRDGYKDDTKMIQR